uniref:Acyl carrier protein n=1 Tax=Oryza barthii TaxID=65489 RepID=A0A0D3HMD0_9ORYZ
MAAALSAVVSAKLGCPPAAALGSWKGSRISSRNLVSMKTMTARRGLVSLRSPRFRVCCAAKAETVGKVMQIVKQQLALGEEAKLAPESQFTELGADSLDTVEIVMALEEEFGITVEEDSAQSITTIQDAADLIDKLVAGGGGKPPAAA